MGSLLYSMMHWGIYGPPWDVIVRILRGQLSSSVWSSFWSYLEYYQIGVET